MQRSPIFFTIFMARSGSKFLRSLLNQHPDINDLGECFHDRKNNFIDDGDVMWKLNEILMDPIAVKGIQFRYPRHFIEFPELVRFMEDNASRLKIIMLKRRNKFRGALSQQNSERLKKMTGKAHLFTSSETSLDPLNLEIDRALVETIERAREDQQRMTWANERFDTLEIFYEDLVSDKQATVDKIFEYLGLATLTAPLAESSLVKVTPIGLSDAITNCAALQEKVSRAGISPIVDMSPDYDAQSVSQGAGKDPWVDHNREGYKIWSGGLTLSSGNKFVLTANRIPTKTNTTFLEHVPPGSGGDKFLAVAKLDNMIVTFDKEGKTNSRVDIGLEARNCFTTSNGHHLIQLKNGEIHRISPDWKTSNRVKSAGVVWHASCSIGQSAATGCIVWAEYPYAAEQVHVWRSTDDGQTWSICHTEIGGGENPKKGGVRHFHTVQPCTTIPGRWYLSSGDTASQCRLWVSENEGESWVELLNLDYVGEIPLTLSKQNYSKLLRFAGYIQLPDKLVWVTDDVLDGLGARLCWIEKDDLSTVHVAPESCGLNEYRSIVQISDTIGLAFSEAKLFQDIATVAVINLKKLRLEGVLPIINQRTTKTNFTNGVTSPRALEDGTFFTQSNNIILSPSAKITRWCAEILN